MIVRSALFAPAAVGVKLSLIVQVPGPLNGPPAEHWSKSNENGAFSAVMPEAPSTSKPASTVIETDFVTVVFSGTGPKSTLAGSADDAPAVPGSASSANAASSATPAEILVLIFLSPSLST